MGNESEARRREGPSWLEPAAQRLDRATNPQSSADAEEACRKGDDNPCADSIDTITQSFDWLNVFASQELAHLQADMTKADKPDWTMELLKGLVAASFAGAVDAIAENIGERAAERIVDAPKTVTEKVVGKAIEGPLKKSIDTGVDKASELLSGEESPDAAEFIAAQQAAVADLYVEAQKQFIHHGRHEIKTNAEASAIEAAVDAPHLKKLAKAHYRISRDRYLAALAKQTAGVADDGSTTNMAPQSQRRDDSRAPSATGIGFGIDKGILSVRVLAYDDVTRKPGAWDAVLSGVNGTIREQYKGTPLSAVNIPRQIVCSVRGDMPDFTFNVDETGKMFLEDGDSAVWLEARARASSPSAATLAPAQLRQLGADLLLQDIQLASIRGGGMR